MPEPREGIQFSVAIRFDTLDEERKFRACVKLAALLEQHHTANDWVREVLETAPAFKAAAQQINNFKAKKA